MNFLVIKNVGKNTIALSKNARSYAASRMRQGGGHHDDHGHHDHKMWETLPFPKSTVATGIFAVLGGGIGALMFSVIFQQYKHGYYK